MNHNTFEDIPNFTGWPCQNCSVEIENHDVEGDNFDYDYEGWEQDEDGFGYQVWNQKHKTCPKGDL